MNLLSRNTLRSVKIILFVFGAFMFCSISLNAQNFIGKDLLACEFTDDFYAFKFINDTVFIKFDLTDEYFPFSTFSINGDTIIWNDLDEDDGCDPELTGEYIFVESGDTLSFDPIFDECSERLDVLENIFFKIVTISNLERIDVPEFKIFPNPVINSFSIITSDQKSYNFQLFNSNGQVVLESKMLDSQSYNIEWLTEGIYFLSITDKNNHLISTNKLFKM